MDTIFHDTLTPDVVTASADYRRRFSGPVGDFFLQTQSQIIKSFIGPMGSKSLKILDVGGGHGQITEDLLRLGHEVWVHGSKEDCANNLSLLFEQFPGQIRFVTSSLWALPFAEKTFDIVIALRLLAHLEHWSEFLKEIVRVSRDRVIVDYPCSGGLNALTPILFSIKRRIEGNTRPYFCYSSSELENVLKSANFLVSRTDKQFFLPMGVHRLINSRQFSEISENAFKRVGLTQLLGSPALMLACKRVGLESI